MKQLIAILKIVLVVSFLFIRVPNDFFIAPVFLWIVATLFNTGNIGQMIFSLLIVITSIYLIKTSSTENKLNDWLCLIAILILNFPIAIIIRTVFAHPNFISFLTCFTFLMVSIGTLSLVIRRLIINTWNENK
ncbi:MAG: hypothetical protein ABI237_02885 [Ginsengibacter sp.]